MILEERIRMLEAACGIALAEDRAGSMMQEAIAAADLGDCDTAIDRAKAILATSPRYVDAAVLLAVLSRDESRPTGTLGLLNQAILQESCNALAAWYLAVEAMSSGNTPVAVALLEAGSKGQPVDCFVLFTLAWLVRTLGATGEANDWFMPALNEQLCPAAIRLLSSNSLPQETPHRCGVSQESFNCLLDLAGAWFNRRIEAVLGRRLAGLRTNANTDISGLYHGRSCSHVNNPAIATHRSRYGQRVVDDYTDAFLQMILGPAIEAEFRRNGLDQDFVSKTEAECPEDMVLVPSAEYTVGSRATAPHHPERKVLVRRFLIDRLPVTNRQWQEFRPSWSFAKGQENHPIVNVDFVQAMIYARWRGRRLPTETEWEAAARGADGRQFPWGNQPDSARANGAEGKLKTVTAVQRYPGGISAFGALDMAGNAGEWADTCEISGPNETPKRVIKGGSYAVRCGDLGCWNRAFGSAVWQGPTVGFRCAMSV